MFNAIAKPFGVLLLWIYTLVQNYGLAILIFAVIVKVILLPFQMKSKKSMMRMSSLNYKVKELEKRHEGNQRKYQEEVAKLYKEEHVSPMSGCLWSLIPFPILIALYQAIRYPLTIMMGVPSALIEEGGSILAKLNELGFTSTVSNTYLQLGQSEFISNHFDAFAGLSDKLVQINYNFLGLNLGAQPQWNFFTKCDWSDVSSWLPSLGLFMIPIVSALLSWVSMKLSQAASPANAQQQSQMKTMNLMMPLVSLYIGFVMPAALGIYWIYSSLLSSIQEFVLNKHYGKLIAKETAERDARDKLREQELEQKRLETERLRAEGATTVNTNTSKKKMQAQKKAELDELKASALRAERAERRAKLGIVEEEQPESQVGSRRYARGRAYVSDRYSHPETAAEATAAAAAESEFGASIDEAEAELEAEELIENAGTVETAGTDEAASEADEDAAEEPEDEESEDDDAEEDQ